LKEINLAYISTIIINKHTQGKSSSISN